MMSLIRTWENYLPSNKRINNGDSNFSLYANEGEIGNFFCRNGEFLSLNWEKLGPFFFYFFFTKN